MDANRAAVVSARPSIEVDGQDTPALASGLLRLMVADSACGLCCCEAEFGNWGVDGSGQLGYLWFDRTVLDFGKSFKVKLGDGCLFDGQIMALEAHFPPLAPPTLVVRADDKMQALRMTRRTRSFDGVSDADLVRRIAGEHGLECDVNLSGPTWPLVVQANESDLAFMRRRAQLADADLVMVDGKLIVRGRNARATPALRLTQGGSLHQFSVCADLAHQRTSLTSAGWDVAGKQALRHEAVATSLGGEASGGDSGPQVLQQALGARKDMIGHRVPLESTGNQAEAEAHLRTLARRFLRGRGEADANAGLHPGGTVDLDGLGPLFDGSYGITDVLHRFDAERGLRSELQVERAWLGRP